MPLKSRGFLTHEVSNSARDSARPLGVRDADEDDASFPRWPHSGSEVVFSPLEYYDRRAVVALGVFDQSPGAAPGNADWRTQALADRPLPRSFPRFFNGPQAPTGCDREEVSGSLGPRLKPVVVDRRPGSARDFAALRYLKLAMRAGAAAAAPQAGRFACRAVVCARRIRSPGLAARPFHAAAGHRSARAARGELVT